MTNYKGITREVLLRIENECDANCVEAVGYHVPGTVDPQQVKDILIEDPGIMDRLRKDLDAKQKIYQDNAELYVICEMALLYLEMITPMKVKREKEGE